jgi:hypothetical protein
MWFAEEEKVRRRCRVVGAVSSCVSYWGRRWVAIAKLRNTAHSFVRQGVMPARPTSERPGIVEPLSKTFALLGVHSYLLSLWTSVKWTGDPYWHRSSSILLVCAQCFPLYLLASLPPGQTNVKKSSNHCTVRPFESAALLLGYYILNTHRYTKWTSPSVLFCTKE